MEEIKLEVLVRGIYYCGSRFGTMTIYNMQDDDGKTLVWKTTTHQDVDVQKGDAYLISARVKGEGEYKGKPQTILERVKFLTKCGHEETYEERKDREWQERKRIQQESITEHDLIKDVSYKEYKERYSDCEAVIDSFYRTKYCARIQIILRNAK